MVNDVAVVDVQGAIEDKPRDEPSVIKTNEMAVALRPPPMMAAQFVPEA